MKVKKLIKELSEFDQNLEVVFVHGQGKLPVTNLSEIGGVIKVELGGEKFEEKFEKKFKEGLNKLYNHSINPYIQIEDGEIYISFYDESYIIVNSNSLTYGAGIVSKELNPVKNLLEKEFGLREDTKDSQRIMEVVKERLN